MKIRVMGEHQAILESKRLKLPTVIISIISKYDLKEVEFANNKNIIDIFRMSFNDLDKDCNEAKAPIQEDFNGLKNFVDKYKDYDMIVHCGAGVSRSAGTALAICQYLDIKTNIDTSPNYIPNRLCYRLALYELTGYRLGDGFLNGD